VGSTVAQIIPLALGIALSPLPVVAVLVILLTRRARFSSVVFAASWVLGVAVAVIIATAFAGQFARPVVGYDLPYEGAVTFLLGAGLVVIAGISRRGRFRSGEPDAPPTWVNAVDDLSPWGGAFVAFTNATTSPKNLALALAAGVALQGTIKEPWTQTLVIAVYVAIASVTVVAPVVLYFVGGERSVALLRRWKERITARAAALTELLLFLLGLTLTVKGLVNLLG